VSDDGGAYPGAREFPQGTRTAADAAAAIGCEVGQIVKSLVFLRDDAPVLVLCSGANTVDEEALGLEKADAALVRERTGFAIGGVPPVGHAQPIATFAEERLLGLEQVWAAAGTPRAVFGPVSPDELVRATGARVVAVASS
jgi:prolyl-tRNA editing enzyme YbaK/EbsC (Cys-tRNA(Pro) deacylase)